MGNFQDMDMDIAKDTGIDTDTNTDNLQGHYTKNQKHWKHQHSKNWPKKFDQVVLLYLNLKINLFPLSWQQIMDMSTAEPAPGSNILNLVVSQLGTFFS